MPRAIVGESVGLEGDGLDELPNLEQEVEFDGAADLPAGNESSTYSNSGTYEIIWERETDEEGDFKPSPRMAW